MKFLHFLSLMSCSVLLACVGIGHQSHVDLVEIVHRDLVEQANNGRGERLAKPIPGQPVLVNNQLVFAMPGDAALGIAMTVGSIKKTVALFDEMPVFDLTQVARENLPQQTDIVRLEPYCYLNGYPKATLESRLLIATSDGTETTLTRTSERLPVEGDDSWSANGGQQLIDTCSAGIAELTRDLDLGSE
ncbi:MAG: hypothetical protein AAF525_05470 [Pseudomonadota bacterium]